MEGCGSLPHLSEMLIFTDRNIASNIIGIGIIMKKKEVPNIVKGKEKNESRYTKRISACMYALVCILVWSEAYLRHSLGLEVLEGTGISQEYCSQNQMTGIHVDMERSGCL